MVELSQRTIRSRELTKRARIAGKTATKKAGFGLLASLATAFASVIGFFLVFLFGFGFLISFFTSPIVLTLILFLVVVVAIFGVLT